MNKIAVLKYFKNLSVYFGASLIPMCANLLANPWIAKNMSPEDYAISGFYTSFSSLIGPIIIFYLIHYYLKEYFRKDEKGRQQLLASIAKATIWFSGSVSIICFIGLLIYLKYFNKNLSFPISPYLALMVFSLPLTGLLNLQLSQYRMEKKAYSFFRLSVFNGLLSIFLNVLFVVWLKWGAFGKLLGPLICNGLVFIIMLYKFRKELLINTSFKEYKTIIRFCFPLAISAMLGYFTSGFSTTYVESIGNVREYGIYVVGISLGGYLSVFSTAIASTFQPDLYENTIKKKWRTYFKFCLIQIGLITTTVICFILLAPFVISLLTAGRYVEATPYARIIAISNITSSIYFIVNNFCIATDRPKLYLYTTIIGSVFIVICMPLFVDKWNFYGGAWMSVLSYVMLTVINLILLGLCRISMFKVTLN